jgi:hypothetical protein
MKIASDLIFNMGCTELLIACQVAGCNNLLPESIENPTTDPVETWAQVMAKLAYQAGWSSSSGFVLCPEHTHVTKPVTI